jgi:uronate dehydrogenase
MKLLLTGASGALGRMLTKRLGERHTLTLTDIRPFPDAMPQGARFEQADLGDKEAVLALCSGQDGVLHFGGISVEDEFEPILNANLRGLHHIFEGARAAGARVVFASSNHAIGYWERDEVLEEDCLMRPDTFYGLSKAYGELMGRLYWDKHGVESASFRIGSCLPQPSERRHLSSWLSHDDLVRLIERSLEIERLGCQIVWGASRNRRRWWRDAKGAAITEVLQDDAESFAEAVLADDTPLDAVSERYQGGVYCAMDYHRDRPSPRDPFDPQ